MKKMEEKMLAEQRRNLLNEQLKAIKKVFVSTLIKYIFLSQVRTVSLLAMYDSLLIIDVRNLFILWEFYISFLIPPCASLEFTWVDMIQELGVEADDKTALCG